MKKFLAMLLAAVMVLGLVACQKPAEPAESKAEESKAEESKEEEKKPDTEKSEGVMTYAEFAAAEIDAEVVIEAYIQAKQVYAEAYSNTSLYLQDADGAYFVYRIACTAEEYDKMVVGSKIKITGFKSEWSGEVEIASASFEMEEGDFLFAAVDLTDALGTEGNDALATNANQFFTAKGEIVASANADGEEVAFLYNWNGSGSEGNDIYYKIQIGAVTYTFLVESDLCPAGSDAYKAAQALAVGDTVTIEGFLYAYNGPQAHTTAISK